MQILQITNTFRPKCFNFLVYCVTQQLSVCCLMSGLSQEFSRIFDTRGKVRRAIYSLIRSSFQF